MNCYITHRELQKVKVDFGKVCDEINVGLKDLELDLKALVDRQEEHLESYTNAQILRARVDRARKQK